MPETIDKTPRRDSFTAVDVFRKCLSLLLLALWLGASMHCDLESAGFWTGHADTEHQSCCAPQKDCQHDGCEIVEGGALAVSHATVRISQHAQALPLFCFLKVAFEATQATIERAPGFRERDVERPTQWMATRHFARRSALPSRAPSA